MKVSVIVPIYKVEKHIERCLRSLFEQTMTCGVEFILINDATPDSSMEIARMIATEYRNLNIKFEDMEKNCGISTIRQHSINISTGKYIIQIDSDDWCELNMLEDMYNKAIEDDADIVISDYYNTCNGVDMYSSQSVSKDMVENMRYLLGAGLNTQLWNKLIRRSIYVDNDINLQKQYKIAEDAIYCVKTLYFSKTISYIPKAYTHYVCNLESVSNNHTALELSDWMKACDEIEQFFNQHSVINEFNDILLEYKMNVKFHTIHKLRGRNQKIFAKKYPEVTPIIWKTFQFGLHNKIAFVLASHGFIFPANLIFKLTSIIK